MILIMPFFCLFHRRSIGRLRSTVSPICTVQYLNNSRESVRINNCFQSPELLLAIGTQKFTIQPVAIPKHGKHVSAPTAHSFDCINVTFHFHFFLHQYSHLSGHVYEILFKISFLKSKPRGMF